MHVAFSGQCLYASLTQDYLPAGNVLLACITYDSHPMLSLQALLTWRDPTATKMVMASCGAAALAVGVLGLPTCLCAFLLYQVQCCYPHRVPQHVSWPEMSRTKVLCRNGAMQ